MDDIKKGDKIVCIDNYVDVHSNYTFPLTVGKVYKVLNLVMKSEDYFEIINDNGDPGHYNCIRFKLDIKTKRNETIMDILN